jgi:hypothetical protein
MKHFIEHIIIGAMLITGIWAACGKEMIFGELADYAEKILPHNLCKPLFVCPACMSSIWGTAYWLYAGGDLKHWIIYILCLCGVMHLVSIHFLKNHE